MGKERSFFIIIKYHFIVPLSFSYDYMDRFEIEDDYGRRIFINCDIEEGLMIDSEENYLEIIFNNLMSNAIKFTDINGEMILKRQYGR